MDNTPNKEQLVELLKRLSFQEIQEVISALSVGGKTESDLSALEQVADDRFQNGVFCPHCGESGLYVRFGFTKGKQRYRCNSCGKTFIATTNSVFAFSKKPLELWRKYMDCMAQGMSIRKAAATCSLNTQTAFIWRHKILDALSRTFENSEQKLKGIVEADETYFALSFKGKKPKSFVYPNDRAPHKRGSENHVRGLSREQVCVPCAIDREKIIVSKAASLGRPAVTDIRQIFSGKIEKKAHFARTRLMYIRLSPVRKGLSISGCRKV
jgi:transposase-like protein